MIRCVDYSLSQTLRNLSANLALPFSTRYQTKRQNDNTTQMSRWTHFCYPSLLDLFGKNPSDLHPSSAIKKGPSSQCSSWLLILFVCVCFILVLHKACMPTSSTPSKLTSQSCNCSHQADLVNSFFKLLRAALHTEIHRAHTSLNSCGERCQCFA